MNQITATANDGLEKRRRNTRSRSAMRDALLQLLETRPLDQITVREITEQAGVGYATFFRHFTDKDALLHDLASGEIRKLLTMALPLAFTVETRPSTEALCAYVWEHRTIWSILLTGGAAAQFKEEFIRQAEQVAAQHPKEDADLPSDLAIIFSVSSALEIIAWWLKQDIPLPLPRMARLLDRLAVQPIID